MDKAYILLLLLLSSHGDYTMGEHFELMVFACSPGQRWSTTKTSQRDCPGKDNSIQQASFISSLIPPRRPVYCWGHKEIPKQSGVITYALSPNRQRPMAHGFYNAIFNTFRRSSAQFLYVAPSFIAAYLLMRWAESR